MPPFQALTEETYKVFVGHLFSYIQSLEDDRFLDRQTIQEYRQLIWGKKSERHINSLAALDLDVNQPELPFEELSPIKTTVQVTVLAAIPAEKEKKEYLRVVKPTGRKQLADTLPREYVEILPENYHEGMVRIDSEVTQELDYRPGSFFVRVITRPRFSDPKTRGVAIAALPPRPIHKGIAGAGLLAYILIARFCDHLPYYRQVKMLNRYGQDIVNTSTMGDWVKETINLLAIIHSRIKKKILESSYLQADETTIKVLDRDKKSGKHQGYLWGYHAPAERLVFMEYGEGRAADYPDRFLGDFHGVFQTDAFSGYETLIKRRPGLTHVCCWAHARRYFTKALESDKKRATVALDMIGELYHVEALARKTNAGPQELLLLRAQRSLAVLARLKQWALLQQKQLNPKASIALACSYVLKRWDKLTYYATDARILIDNNLLENRFRPVALGRKNWLFAGNHQSAERSGIIYSILESCALNQVEPFTYLQDMLTKLPHLQFAPPEKIDELLPSHWKPSPPKIYARHQNPVSQNVA